jgi:type II secretory pathway component PulJ
MVPGLSSSADSTVGQANRGARHSHPAGYTLVEVLIATTLALMLMAAVAQMFAQLGSSVNNSRATLETADRLRAAAMRLQMDLDGVTVTMLPPRRVEDEEGYFEYIEGGTHELVLSSSGICPSASAVNSLTGSNDSAFTLTTVTAPSGGTSQVAGTVGETADILMFTTRNPNRPFTGMYQGNTIQSETAEVAWFMRGHNLYRRVLLVVPGLNSSGALGAASNFYAQNDISVHVQGTSVVANTLGDLTRRECRFAHDPTKGFPYNCAWGILGLPTLRDGIDPGSTCQSVTATNMDYWNQSQPFVSWSGSQPPMTASGIQNVDKFTGAFNQNSSPRSDDLILTNVIGFDVKAWDPGKAAYVDLGTPATTASSGTLSPSPAAVTFATSNVNTATTSGTTALGADGGLPYYDTWSTSYENLGIGNTANAGQAVNGFDKGTGVVDNPANAVTAPPFMVYAAPAAGGSSVPSWTPTPLRGIQVKIRVFEPDSRSIREVTVTQDFLPK